MAVNEGLSVCPGKVAGVPATLVPGAQGGLPSWRADLPTFQLLLPARWLMKPGSGAQGASEARQQEQGGQATF